MAATRCCTSHAYRSGSETASTRGRHSPRRTFQNTPCPGSGNAKIFLLTAFTRRVIYERCHVYLPWIVQCDNDINSPNHRHHEAVVVTFFQYVISILVSIRFHSILTY